MELLTILALMQVQLCWHQKLDEMNPTLTIPQLQPECFTVFKLFGIPYFLSYEPFSFCVQNLELMNTKNVMWCEEGFVCFFFPQCSEPYLPMIWNCLDVSSMAMLQRFEKEHDSERKDSPIWSNIKRNMSPQIVAPSLCISGELVFL